VYGGATTWETFSNDLQPPVITTPPPCPSQAAHPRITAAGLQPRRRPNGSRITRFPELPHARTALHSATTNGRRRETPISGECGWGRVAQSGAGRPDLLPG
jgi:hypothetical protein